MPGNFHIPFHSVSDQSPENKFSKTSEPDSRKGTHECIKVSSRRIPKF